MCVQVIGAGALNQAVKAIAIARAFVSEEGIDPICIPTFHDVDIGGESRTAIRLQVEHRTDRLQTDMPNPQPSQGETGTTIQA